MDEFKGLKREGNEAVITLEDPTVRVDTCGVKEFEEMIAPLSVTGNDTFQTALKLATIGPEKLRERLNSCCCGR